MSASPQRKAEPRATPPAAPPETVKRLSRWERIRALFWKEFHLSDKQKLRAHKTAAYCGSLFLAGIGVMSYLYGSDRMEFERNRHDVWAKQRVDALRERDVMKQRKNVTNSAFSIEKSVSQPGAPEYLVTPDEAKTVTL